MSSYQCFTRFAVAGLVGLAACSAPGDNGPMAIAAPSSAQRLVVGDPTDDTPELGVLKVCKTGNAGGEFTISRSQFGDGSLLGYLHDNLLTATLDAGACR